MTKIKYIAMDVHKEKIVVGESEIVGEYDDSSSKILFDIYFLTGAFIQGRFKICIV